MFHTQIKAGVLNKTMQFGGIGISNLPNQHCSNSTKKTHSYNLIIAGARGLGKTTFMNNLVRKKIFRRSLYLEKKDDGLRELQFIENDILSSPKSYDIGDDYIKYDEGEGWSTTWLEEHKVTFELTLAQVFERGIRVNFSTLEVSNIGDCIDNTDAHIPIINYINRKYKEYYENERKYRRDEIIDTRIHACLYFFEPAGHWIREIDKKNILEISKICVVIPVVARSDMFTMEEREIIRTNFHKTLEDEKIGLYRHLQIVPFFVVSNHIDEFGIVYERQYMWGSVQATNKYICDTEELRNVVIRDQMLYVIEECDKFYRLYRNAILKDDLIKYVKTEAKVKNYEQEEFDKFLLEWSCDQEMLLD